ncbi:MAG: tetratricopeptide repeat protein [Planctomycetes bacterium]|nr:tetratricopeptide repeat protein [Planctomycetota bacterium]
MPDVRDEARLNAETDYLFRHALLRDVAYQLLPPAERALLHAWVVRILNGDPAAALMEIADHATLAGQSEQQVIAADELERIETDTLQRASQIARDKYEHEVALNCLDRLAAHSGVSAREAQQARFDSALIRAESGRFEDSLATLELLYDDPVTEADLAVEALLYAAGMDRNRGELESAGELANRAERLIEDNQLENLRPRLSVTRGRNAMLNKQLDESRTLLQAGLHGARDHNDHTAETQALRLLSIIHRDQHDFTSAMKCLDELDMVNQQGTQRRGSETFNARGNVYWRQGRTDDAEREYLRALERARERGDTADIAVATGNLGNIANDRRDYTLAAQRFKEAIALCRELGLIGHVGLWTLCLGNVHLYGDDLDNAELAYREAARMHELAGDVASRASALANAGLVMARRGLGDEALDLYQQAEALAMSIGNLTGAASHVARQAVIYTGRKEYPKVRERLTTALGLYAKAGAQESVNDFVWQTELGECELQLNNRKAATKHARNARAIAGRLGLPAPTSSKGTLTTLDNLKQLEHRLGIAS